MALISLGFAVCELRKALIYKGLWRAVKTPKAGVAGSIPAGRAKNHFKYNGLQIRSFAGFSLYGKYTEIWRVLKRCCLGHRQRSRDLLSTFHDQDLGGEKCASTPGVVSTIS